VRRAWSVLAAATVLALLAMLDAPVTSGRVLSPAGQAQSAADSHPVRRDPVPGHARAPTAPPLSAGPVEGSGETRAAGTPDVEVDPLVSNGLGSPFCKGVLGEGALSHARALDCQTSGFSAAGAPTGNWSIDVHIDTGLFGISSGALLIIVQDLFVSPLWMAVVWLVHALVVMLEWCFAIDLLDSAASGSLGVGLRQMQAAFTEPWLAGALSVASVLALYNGLVRRRVADTAGQVVAMLVMMAAAMWLIADPQGTVGALGRIANQASLGTLAVSARGSTTRPGAALADSMAVLFASAIEAPWCYLEFGDVAWCRDRTRLDPRLHAAALRIAATEVGSIGCGAAAGSLTCVQRGSAQARSLQASAALLRSAPSNGAIFLAVPANGPVRNSINDEGSLLRTICQTSEATRCRGPTAAQAQFRTNSGTWPRVGGLLLIVAGVLGMILLFGFIALRLLGAAVFSLLYLLLAPIMILAPAFGEAGRAVFRRWAAQLFAAVVAKLIFSFVLGVVLAVLAILANLEGLGWWTQWLLMSAFWWGAFARRHQALALADGALGGDTAHRRSGQLRRRIGRIDGPLATRVAKRVERRAAPDRAKVKERQPHRPPAGPPARPSAARAGDDQVRRMLEHERRQAGAPRPSVRGAEARLLAARARLGRLQRERVKARGAGNTRRAAELAARESRVEQAVRRRQDEIEALKDRSGGQHRSRRRSEERTPQRAAELANFLDWQAALPASRDSIGRRSGARRSYAELAPLVGLAGERYLRLAPREQRAARVEIDRELASRHRSISTVGKAAEPAGSSPPTSRSERAGRPPARGGLPPTVVRDRAPGSASTVRPRESSVMRDAREVAAKRKRQLGIGRP
jgi:hypothetical protein